MKYILKTLTALLLVFTGTSAIYGGANLISYDDGSSLRLSLDLLKHSPFNDYFIPGIVLLTAIGLFSFFVLASLTFNAKNNSLLIFSQGSLLMGWIIVQVTMTQTIHFLHLIFALVGSVLIISGITLNRMDRLRETRRSAKFIGI
jgi:hypothetical protein